MTAIVTRGDAGNLHLPDETVDLIVTSPPYFGLRSYQDGGEHYVDQIGAEATPAEYLDALMACTAEWMRVLKPGGSIFVNLGDKYSGAQQQNSGKQSKEASSDYWRKTNPKNTGIPAKSLMAFPWRYAIRCIDELGLILRAEIVWAKPNGLPESVTDRVRRSHEQVFHFVKQPRYYSAVDEVREPSLTGDRQMFQSMRRGAGRAEHQVRGPSDLASGVVGNNPLGKLPGSVWSIPTAPLRVPESLGIDHFAAYPPELVRRIVLGWSPREVCCACGEGRQPVVEKSREPDRPNRVQGRAVDAMLGAHGADGRAGSRFTSTATITGYTCGCKSNAELTPTRPGVVLDPFGGTGTTALVASVHGRIGISNDLSSDYCRLAQWRTTDEKQRAKAAGVKPKPPKKAKPQPVADVIALPGQLDLTEEWTA